MAHPCEAAITMLEAELAPFAQGSKQQPKDGTPEWFLLRAKAHGLTLLKRMVQLGVHESPKSSELFARSVGRFLKADDVLADPEATLQ